MAVEIRPIRVIRMPSDLPFHPERWFRANRGPRYVQLYRYIAAGIASGAIEAEAQLPPERELARLAQVSRVTVRQAVAQLVSEGLLEQRRGAGTFVRPAPPKLEQSLSALLSFTEYMRARGKISTSQIIRRGLFLPSPDEQMALGLSNTARVARVDRIRFADGVAIAIEYSSLPQDILPDPEAVQTSLYDVLRGSGLAPIRAVQRIGAVNIGAEESGQLNLAEGTAVLKVDRTAYLPTGRPIEFTRGLYRSDIYDFVAELRQETAS